MFGKMRSFFPRFAHHVFTDEVHRESYQDYEVKFVVYIAESLIIYMVGSTSEHIYFF